MFDYLYYKLYQAALKSSVKDIPHIAAAAWFGALIGANILVIYLFLVKINTLPYLFRNSKQGGWFFALFIVFAMLYYRKDKREFILEKYSQESERKRVRGNIIVSVYVALSFLLLFAVAFFRPGKL
jgi:hypothetical protein